MMKVSVSFLSSKNIPSDLVKLDNTDADFIHVDVMDGKFVKRKTMPFREMKNIGKYTSKRLDVHLMVKDVFSYIKDYVSLNWEYITIHVENDQDYDLEEALKLIKSYSIKAGLALNPDTPVSALVPYLHLIDYILIMSVVPGEGGQSFIEESVDKIIEVRKLIEEYNVDVVVNIDGGINDSTVLKCRDCDIVTSGNFITSSDDFQKKINSLR